MAKQVIQDFRTISYGRVGISLIGKTANERVFAEFDNTVLQNPSPEVNKALQRKHDEYEEKNVPIRERGFVTQLIYEAYVTPDKSYISYKGKMVHYKDVVKGLEIAEKNGWEPEDKNYIFINKPQVSQHTVREHS